MNDAYKKCLGEVISEKRRIANINRRRLSMMTGLSRPTIRSIEMGVGNPGCDVLLRMTQGIGVSLAEVFAECEHRLRELPTDELDEHYILFEAPR